MGRQNRQTRSSAKMVEQNGGGKSAGSGTKSLPADVKSGVKRTSVEAGSRSKKTRKVPVVVLENLQDSDLMSNGANRPTKKSTDNSSKGKKQAKEAVDDNCRNGKSGSEQKTVKNNSEVEKCVAGKEKGKGHTAKSNRRTSAQKDEGEKEETTGKRKGTRKRRKDVDAQEEDCMGKEDDDDFEDDRLTTSKVKKRRSAAKSNSNGGVSTQTDKGEKEETTNKRKAARKKIACAGGQEKGDRMGKADDDFEDTAKVKKMRTSQESVEDDTAKVNPEVEASTSGAEMADAQKNHHESSDSDSEWEEVEEVQAVNSPEKKLQDISIELSEDAIPGMSRKKKKQFDWKGYIKREIRRMNKEQRESLHKAHLLSLLACVLYRSRVCNDPDLAGLALSLTPTEIVSRRRWDVGFLSKVVKWFRSKFPLVSDEEESEDNGSCTVATLGVRLQEGKVMSENERVWLFVVILRMLQLDIRLVVSLQPIPWKEPSPSKSKRNESQGGQKKKLKSAPKSKQGSSTTKKSAKQARNVKQSKTGKRGKLSESSDDSSTEQSSSKKSDPPSRRQQKTKNSRPRRRASKTKPMVEVSESDDEESSHSEYAPESSTDVKDSSSRDSDVLEVEEIDITMSDDSDLEIVDVSKLRVKKSGKQNQRPSRKIISDDDSDENEDAAVCNEWVEVYIEERWVTVDVVSGMVDKPELVEQRVTRPMAYVVGVDADGSVKDVTRRYAAGWMTSTRLLREDRYGTWWPDTLRLYASADKDRSKKEDLELHSKLLQKPIPTTIRDFKDHPLYALRRHLLKYEAVYPETAAVLGYCKGEPVYARECVHQLHTRDKWLQEARVVRHGEEPYKMVKHNNPGWLKRKMERKGIFTTGNPDEPTVPLFGRWQTEDYMPPLAVDGKVPRNDYGNVDLYLPCMLPQGTVHLQIPGLERVARKLDIDCAPAVTGFDFHSGWSHPVKDGYIVCEEHKDLLIAAWEEDRQNREQREKDKREKRSLDNWRKLTKALLISQRLKRRYQVQNEHKLKSSVEGEDIDDDDDDDSGDDRAVDVEKSWPRKDFSQQAASTSSKAKSRAKKRQKEDTHLFPFEKL